MIVILNSDILYHTHLLKDRFSPSLELLFRACADTGEKIVIPLTTLLEFEHKQTPFVEREKSDLQRAYAILVKYRLQHRARDPNELVAGPDLVRMIQNCGVQVDVEEPTLADFRDAHTRACLHQAPHPGQKESDEMRDLIIWALACRRAKAEGGALLVSRDEVHTNHLGDEEAKRVGLHRVSTVEEAFETLHVRTPSGEAIVALVSPLWDDFKSSGIPLKENPSGLIATGVNFIQGKEGPEFVKFQMTTKTPEEKMMTAHVEITIRGQNATKSTLKDIRIDGKPWDRPFVTVEVERKIPVKEIDYQERLRALKAAVGAQE